MKLRTLSHDFYYTNPAWLLLILLAFAVMSCEPVATTYPEESEAQYYSRSSPVSVPDTFQSLRVMTWNIRFGAGRAGWFGDACSHDVIFTADEIYASLEIIAAKIMEVKPDILLLQEGDIDSKRSAYIDQVQWLLEHTYFNYAVSGAQWKSQFIPSDGLGRMNEVNAIFSRWSLTDAVRTQLPLRTDQDGLTRYFYERPCMVTARVNLPWNETIYAVNIHVSATATTDIKQQHILMFSDELRAIAQRGAWFIAGGDLNTLPPGSDTTDYCMQDRCEGESFHHSWDDPMHKEGCNYTPEIHFLDTLYASFRCAVPTPEYMAGRTRYFTHTTRPGHFWDRTLDYLFTNGSWRMGGTVTHQEALEASDHCPLTAVFQVLPAAP